MSGINCGLCPNNCLLSEGKTGICGVRTLCNGKVKLLTYGKFSSVCIDPVEKKPLYHIKPGSKSLSLGTIGCNFHCPWCQNWTISQRHDPEGLIDLSPEKLLALVIDEQLDSVSFTYNEPIISYEYIRDASKLLTEHGIDIYIVSAGYIDKRYRESFFENCKATNIDLKSFNKDIYKRKIGGDLEVVLDTLKYLARSDTWLEITTLLVPGINDPISEIKELSSWIKNELGENIPLHFSAFHPAYRMNNTEATNYLLVKEARKIAMDIGLKYVYTGNIIDSEGSNTYCPKCGSTLIEREGFRIIQNRLNGSNCPNCNHLISGVF